MGCASSKKSSKPPKRGKRGADQGVDVEDPNVSFNEDGYPTPAPPEEKKKKIYNPNDFRKVEENAVKTPVKFLDSYDALIKHLITGTKSDLEKLRAIFVWIGSQKIEATDMGQVKKSDSPRAYMKWIQDRKGSYGSFFALLCRKAGMPCKIQTGIAKSASYEVGDRDVDHLRNRWNIVYVDGSWRLIHPLWAFRSLSGHNSGNWTLVEAGGVKVNKKQAASEGQLNFQVNDYWFLTDPEEFFIHCFPDEPEWQLLEKQRNKEDFLDVPFCRQAFHELEFNLTGEKKCSLDAIKGEIEIPMEIPNDLSERMKVTYDLFHRDDDGTETTHDNVQLDRYVFQNQNKTKFVFAIRFPASGIFKISIYGNDVSAGTNALRWLCDFRIDCIAAKLDCQPLPDCPDIGWGAGVDAELAGIQPLTHHNGLIQLKKREIVVLKFRLNIPMYLQAELLHNNIKKNRLQSYLTTTVTDTEATVKVDKLPEQGGEFALKLNSRQDPSEDENFYNFVNYLIVSPEEKIKPRRRSRPRVQPEDKENSTPNYGREGLVEPTAELVDIPSTNNLKTERALSDYSDAMSTGNSTLPANQTQDSMASEEINSSNGFYRQFRKNMVDATDGDDYYELDKAIIVFEKHRLEDRGDLARAKDQREHLKLKKVQNEPNRTTLNLEDGMKRRHADTLEVAIQNARNSHHESKLDPEPLTKAEELLAHLRRLDRFRHPILQMNQRIISEIARYNTPRPIIHAVLKSTFMLLGEAEHRIEEWSYIQALLRKTGRHSLKQRIATFDTVHVMEEMMEKARTNQQTVNLDQARTASAVAGTFHQWNDDVLQAVDSDSDDAGYDDEPRAVDDVQYDYNRVPTLSPKIKV